jgi:surface carbohydrate biosynthesis protein
MALPTLIIPIEIKSREFRSRLLVAGHAVSRGFPVLLGPSSNLHSYPERFTRGVIVENDVTAASQRFSATARELGFRLVAWDEEAIAVLSDDWYARQRVSEGALACLDIMFCRGKGDAESVLSRFPHMRNQLVACGNPRLDLLRPGILEKRSVEPGAPIVVMSRFSRSNPFSVSRAQAAENAVRKFRFSPQDERFYRGFLEYTHEIFDAFLPFVVRLTEKFPREKIVIRPHPSENYGVWEALAAKYANLVVDASGSAEEMARIAKLVIHNGCTTGIEAALLGCPVFSFMPFTSPDFDVPLPNLVSRRFSDESSLFSAIVQLSREPGDDEMRARNAWREIETRWIGDGSGRPAHDIILDHLANTYRDGLPPTRGRHRAAIKVRSLSAWRSLRRGRKTSAQAAYKAQKLAQIGHAEIIGQLAEFGFPNHRVVPVSNEWWSITSP